jgi:endonuclease IV
MSDLNRKLGVHTSYLINLAASDNSILEKSIDLLIQEMDIADLLDADYVILHTGSASQDTEEKGQLQYNFYIKQ